MEYELKNGVYVPKAIVFEDELAQKPEWCARYARLVSLDILIGSSHDEGYEIWEPSHAWNFGYENRSVWKIREGKQFNASKLKEGQILGIRIPYSGNLNNRDDRRNFAQYTHMATYIGDFIFNGSVGAWIMHNLYGDILAESLRAFLKRTGSTVMEIFSPRDESVLRE